MTSTEGQKEQHEHCWHSDDIMLTSYPAQYPEICCHCGAKCTRRKELEKIPDGHGPHYPRGYTGYGGTFSVVELPSP